MSDIKRDVRDMEDDAKEALRKSDGESLGDKLANAGDRIRHGVENVGDELHEKADEASRKLEYERGRADEAMNRKPFDRDM
jgi:ElaB/YqjD/DUF883 family membrane-anchored ribosome-binding protein